MQIFAAPPPAQYHPREARWEERAELTVEVLGHQGLGWTGESFSQDEIMATRAWLRGKSGTIAGGSYEIQNNIISKRILGLPETTQKG